METSNPPEGSSKSPDAASNAAKPPRPLLKKLLKILGVLIAVLLTLGIVAFSIRDKLRMYGNFKPDINMKSKEKQFEQIEKDRAARKKSKEAAPAKFSEAEIASLAKLPSWPDYRGPRRDGISTETGLLKEWPKKGPPELYRAPIGLGWGGFAIGLGRAYTLEQRREKEVLACYDFENGNELWAYSYPALFTEQMGGEGPRSTPSVDGTRVYALGAAGDFNCVDALTGERLWGTNILKDTQAKNLHWAMSGSPLIIGDAVYVTASGDAGKVKPPSVLAFEKGSGKLLWKNVPQQQSYSSLAVETVAGKRQILDFAASNINGLDIETGNLLWSFPWELPNRINVAQPIVVGGDRVFISSGYGKGCTLLEIKSTGEGKFEASQVWVNKMMKNKFTSSILQGDYIYGLDEGIMTCLNVKTGKREWKGGRYGHGQILLAEGKLIVLGEMGQLALVKIAPERFEEISQFEAFDSKTWNVPALAGGRLLVRNDREMACYNLKE